ncbi:MAG: LysM peptidoglycan-binding domain-containing protein [Chloroflexi bacterium]|nr:LysM peptidoglycan-binding domain-containing protein [Chloroflexota bacterium]
MRGRLFWAPRALIAAFALAIAASVAPAAVHADGPPSGGFMYVVQYGDTLDSIAARFGVSAQAIARANGLAAGRPDVGRALQMPYGYPASAAAYSPTTQSNTYFVYQVQSGDTLAGISRRYGVPVDRLISANHLYNPSYLHPRMRMYVPKTTYYPSQTYATGQTYVVQAGDTLSRIALRFGTTVYALQVANGIANPNLIFAGMRLVLPAASYAYAPPASGYPSTTYYPTPSGYPPQIYYPTPGPYSSVPPPSTATTVQVSLMNMAYYPNSLTVHVGTTVVWINNDTMQHTVTSGTPGAPSGTFESGTLNPGQSYQFTFNAAATYPYYCRIHGAAMTGTIYVVP